MVQTRIDEDLYNDVPEGSTRQGGGNSPKAPLPPPPVHLVSIEQLVAMQNRLLQRVEENEEHRVAREQQQQQQQPQQRQHDSYSDFLVTNPLVFTEATDMLEADN
jgi:hypothetical protein